MNTKVTVRLGRERGTVHIFGTAIFLILAFLVWSWFNSQRQASHIDRQLDNNNKHIELLERRVQALEERVRK